MRWTTSTEAACRAGGHGRGDGERLPPALLECRASAPSEGAGTIRAPRLRLTLRLRSLALRPRAGMESQRRGRGFRAVDGCREHCCRHLFRWWMMALRPAEQCGVHRMGSRQTLHEWLKMARHVGAIVKVLQVKYADVAILTVKASKIRDGGNLLHKISSCEAPP